MREVYEYNPIGVCSTKMIFTIEKNKIIDLKIIGGCPGNLQGISQLVKNMDIDEVIIKLKDIKCGMKKTSCPDQISKALEKYKNNKN
ncbi:MAG: TIGR03905 family TSCPD domain-containing protein [Bacilli bacterium]|nr:TIGR03905 family TSCPD domain-containing protein [Bacilli bacterium]MBP3920051.1 TIGR03905 family TSCPD domain-containing protein [Bacilli bacterium]